MKIFYDIVSHRMLEMTPQDDSFASMFYEFLTDVFHLILTF